MIYLDDSIPTHPKLVRAGDIDPTAPWLWLSGLGYCRKHLTSGLIPVSMLPALTPLFRPKARDALVQVGLWEPVGLPDGPVSSYQVHDYVDWNGGEDAQREARSEKARRAAQAKWEKVRNAQT